jgi:hypothetical protein
VKCLKILSLCLLLCFLSIPVFAQESLIDSISIKPDLRQTDTFNSSELLNQDEQLQRALIVIQLVDWLQTRTIATQGHWKTSTIEYPYGITEERKYWEYDYYELNPLLGKRPSLSAVDTYFAASIVANILIFKYTNPKFKKWWSIIGISLETYCITGNISAGVGFKI